MALLSRKVDYALIILSYLYHRQAELAQAEVTQLDTTSTTCDSPISARGGCAREIAERFGLSRPFTANILKLLARKGLVSSQRGSQGGYFLLPSAHQLCLADLLESFEEPFQLSDCFRATVRQSVCEFQLVCPVRGALANVDERIREVLKDVTLEALFRQSNLEATKAVTDMANDLVPLGVSLCNTDT